MPDVTDPDRPSRIVVEIEDDDQGQRVANPRLVNVSREEGAEALRAAAEVLAPAPTPEPTDLPRTFIDTAILAIDGDPAKDAGARNYGAGITAALIAINSELRTANLLGLHSLRSIVQGVRPTADDIAAIEQRMWAGQRPGDQ